MKLPVCSRCKCKEFEIMEDDGVDGAATGADGWVWTLAGQKVRQIRVGERLLCRECGRITKVRSV